MRHQVARELQQVITLIDLDTNQPEQADGVAHGHLAGKLGEDRRRDFAQQGAGVVRTYRAIAEYRELLERGQGVAHASACVLCHNIEGLIVKDKTLPLADIPQTSHDILVRDTVEIKALAPRENGFQDLLRIGGA